MNAVLYIPTFNAGKRWPAVVAAINEQHTLPYKKVIIDSGSTDQTLSLPSLSDYEIIRIPKHTFDHGGTRQYAVQQFPDADLYIFLTQDAILANRYALHHLIRVFENDPTIGCAYGRQLPHQGARVLEAHARLFSYPAHMQLRNMDNARQYGIQAASCSNSFAAYRRTAFEEVGGFPNGTILGEDVIAAGQILLHGWQLAYVADAQVYHSHNYSIIEEFRRYFDIGVFHATHPWIFTHFGRAGGNGLRYVRSVCAYVLKRAPWLLPKTLFSIMAKWLGYALGLRYRHLSPRWCRSFSMHSGFWKRKS